MVNSDTYIKGMSIIIRFIILVLLWTACSDESLITPPDNNLTVFMDINLNTPEESAIGTKAMDNTQESAIDDTKLQILVFEQTGAGEVFRYQATITELNLPQVTINVPASKADEKYRFVILANVEQQAIADGTSKADALSQFTFDCMGKWNASSPNPSKFPMWGEFEPIKIEGSRWINIDLHRALARVDVGVLFKYNNPDPVTGAEYPQKETDKESVYGLDHFKINSVRVYRAKNSAYAASSANLMTGNEVTTPLIPPSSNYNSNSGTEYTTLENADRYPLFYELPAAANSYTHEIYIPESRLIDAQSDMDNVPCLVVGGYYGAGNTTKETYYRADFATYHNGSVTAYKPILRNHRYVFDIKSVNGPGFDTPEQALKSINSPMELNIVVWNEVALNFYVQGRYYFNISEREIEMEARPKVGETDITYTVYFDTNLGLDGSDGRKLEYEWQSSGSQTSSYFDITVNYVDKTITFHALSENVGSGSGDRLDIVTLTSENIGFTVKINQEAFRLDYELLCASTEVHGKYVEDVSLNYTNYITVKVRTNGSDFHGERYEIQTEEKNGIYFRAEGTFDSSEATALGDGNYEYDIKLDGFGTPVKENIADEILKSFDVKITSNSVSNAYCESTIVIGYKSRKILTIGSNASYLYGYMLEPGTASRTFVDASINFGTSQNSTVNMEENESGNTFTIEIITEGQGMAGGQIDYTYLKNKINTFKPDIILTGYYVNYYTVGNGTEVIGLLSDFVDAGGVFLMISEYYPDLNSVNAMVGEIIPGATGDKQDIGLDQAFVIQSVDDPVTQGPFGDMRGQKWGADGHEMYGFENLPANTIIYSSTTSSPGRACMFRHAEKPFFFIGDGGFISNPQRYLGDSYQGSYVYCPFAIDRNYRQVSRKNYTSTMNVEVFNSAIFGNILTWAVDYAETYGIEYPEVGNKFP